VITPWDFWKGRDRTFAEALTDEILENGRETIKRANALLADFYEVCPTAYTRGCNSGWRPPEVNAATRGAAKGSKHLSGQAIDLSDDDDALDRWLMTPAGRAALIAHELFLEHPSATPRWSHLQTVPPRSGNRVFFP
jgi:hypothetical protein